MSGEFGQGTYQGRIHEIIWQLGEALGCDEDSDTRIEFESSRAVGRWLYDDVANVLGNVAYNESFDSEPGETMLSVIDRTIEGLRVVRKVVAADIEKIKMEKAK